MDEKLVEVIRAEIARNIKEVVNGKIDRLTDKLENHIVQHTEDQNKLSERFDPDSEHYILRDAMPIIEAYKGTQIIGSALKWATSVGVAYLSLKQLLS